MEKERHVTSIEIGTCFSGIVYASIDDFLKDPRNGFSPIFSSSLTSSLQSKCRTCLLFDPTENFHSFGQVAEEEYLDLASENKHRDWSFFTDFIPKLNQSQLSDEDVTLTATNGRKMSAKAVVTTLIKCLMNELFKSSGSIMLDYMKWVLVVPSSWKQSSKNFLKECCIQAGMEEDRICIVLTTHAVTLHAKYNLPKVRGKDLFSSDNSYMVVDAGGGSIDTTIFDVQKDGNIAELFVSSEKFMGSEKFTSVFHKTLEKIIGREEFENYRDEFYSDFVTLNIQTENKMIHHKPGTTGFLRIKLPPSLIELLRGKLDDSTEFKGLIKLTADKLSIAPKEVDFYLKAPVTDICHYVDKALAHPKGQIVKTILLVGGFSECKMLVKEMQEQNPEKAIMVLPDACLAALRGALIYGFNPKIIGTRNASFTYGYTYIFRKENKKECLKTFDKNAAFHKIMKIGSVIEEEKTMCQKTFSCEAGAKCVSFFFYASTENSPMGLLSENTFFIGSNSLNFDEENDIPHEITFSVSFTGTLMKVTLGCLESENKSTVYLNSGYKLDTDEYEYVAAIDFGTTYSGFAYLSKHDYKHEQGKRGIVTKIWYGGSLMSLKTSTSILFTPEDEFDSFGFEAEDNYSDLVSEGKHDGWSLFRRFKMKLYKEMNISGNFKLTAENGKKMEASKVFTAALKYIKMEALDDLRKRNAEVPENYIQWVLTVPAIWTDTAKSFMRQCAVMADINISHLVLALEPEAASLYAQILSSSDLSSGTGRKLFRKGVKYLVCDAGGGTIDTTVHEIIDEYNHVRELHKASGGNWGGTIVDEKWIEFLEELSGKEAMDEFKGEKSYDVLDLYRDFEVKKRSVTENPKQKIQLKIPVSLTNSCKKYNEGQSLSEKAENSKKYGNNIKSFADKIIITADIAKLFFMESLSRICDHLKTIFQHPNANSVNIILLVGGYAECPLLLSAIKNAFPTKTIIVPPDAGLAVLKGAVLFGHNPLLIKERIAKYTYGIATFVPFQNGIHEKKYAFKEDGQIWCDNVFDRHVRIGDKMCDHECQSSKLYYPFEGSEKIEVPVYASTFENPVYVTDDGCSLIGKIYLDYNDYIPRKDSQIKVSFSFGGTEIEVKVECQETGKSSIAYLGI